MDEDILQEENKNINSTTYLLPKNNFWIGRGSIFNVFGRYFTYNYSKSSQEADENAIASDWAMVGEDFKMILSDLKWEK